MSALWLKKDAIAKVLSNLHLVVGFFCAPKNHALALRQHNKKYFVNVVGMQTEF